MKACLKGLIREILVEDQEAIPSYNPAPSSLLTYQDENKQEEVEEENIFKLIGNEEKNEPEEEDEGRKE
eukprot:CAMPEP_0202962992 /NCGR_PEP_ID=MMETSP1396-20130829/7002_1 /ASSEMBLY_ACC=CAM_ASM_000872 /TAXON_ID= /ORGANISM="Pseudokeronopsis sp., Strain Brazil" /LENGTH=68 /DNA_ID=CAMNT_0049683873 /DNA_START=639 /DNA_END=845 /DNA_ORIENTATION=-